LLFSLAKLITLNSGEPSGRRIIHRTEGLTVLEMVKSQTGGGRRLIPKWAEAALEKRLQEPEQGFDGYGAVQEWLAQTLGVEAKYHAVYQMTRYRLKAELKVPRPRNYQ
jgi:hypothetical protein